MFQKQIITVVHLLMLPAFFFISGCQDDLPVKEQAEAKSEIDLNPSGPAPRAVIVDGIYDFGSMEVGQTLRHTFTIRNDGKGLLKLKYDRSTCKCTMAELKKNELAPGESTTAELEWVGKVLDPNFSHAAYLKTNDPKNEEIALTVAGRVDSSYNITPAGVWYLGEMNRGEPTEFSGKISSRVREDFNLKEVVCKNPLVSVQLTPMDKKQLEEEGAKKGYLINGQVAPGSPLGVFSEKVEMAFLISEKGKEEVRPATITVEGYYSGPFKLIGPPGWVSSKMTMNFRTFSAEKGKKAKISMYVKDNKGPLIEIKEVLSTPDFLKVTLQKDEKFQEKGRERYDLIIEVPPGAPPSQFYKGNPATIKVVTNNPIVGTMNIRVQMVSF